MPIEFIYHVHPHLDIAVWDITESVEELRTPLILNQQEEKELAAITHDRSKKQWLGARNLLRAVLKKRNQVMYNPLGVPSLKDNAAHISLSHSGYKVALSSNKKFETGVDIQNYTEKIQNIEDKFCSEDEKNWMPKNEERMSYLHLLWGVKESLFKYYTTQMPFTSVTALPFDLKNEGKIEAIRKREGELDAFHLSYRIFNDYFLVYLKDIISSEQCAKQNISQEKAR
ncbi:MAG: 4'-phosphopantetheinyl transferase superfamily protein [Flavobacteriales bacterium]|nr:4'-phosphopantetheinyl transferase superfamily protein [Flavobacteriales bacterium]